MTAPENEFDEWTQPDPADVAAHDARMSAYTAQETARQQERAAAEERRQAMLAGDGARAAEASRDWRMAQQEHRAAALEFTSIAEQQQGQRDAEMEACS
jgi:hypothetical protein